MDTIRLFIGADSGNCDLESQAVAEWTARRHCSMPLEITWMQQARKGFWSGWNTAKGRTPFTHFRWGIPAYCGFEGRALYSDSDFIFTADLAELWRQPIDGVVLLKSPEGKLKTCCMAIDCARATGHFWTLDKLRAAVDVNGSMLNYFRSNRRTLAAFEGDWNCIDGASYESLNDPQIKAIHYSRIETQLHLKYAIPRLAAEGKTHWYTGEVRTHWRQDLIDVFDRELAAATANGYPPDRYRREDAVQAVRKDFRYSAHRGSVAS
jgi:hypothetical protein